MRVPLGGRSLIGVVWDEAGGELAADRLKPIAEILPVRALTPDLRRFVERVAAYTMAPPGAVLRMAMSVAEALQPPRPRRLCTTSAAGLAALADSHPATTADACAPPGARNPARRSAAAGRRGRAACRLRHRRRARPRQPRAGRGAPGRRRSRRLAGAGLARTGPALSPDQAPAARRLVGAVEAGGFGVTVLDGVTGSGKTETYFAAIAAALAAGRQVLVLLPEIALGAQWLQRFRQRFGALPAQWHSDIGQAERRDTWRAVAAGRARVVVGARSALFLPFAELGPDRRRRGA